MRAVNLLPEKHRPRRPTGGGQGSSYILLGVLGALLVGVLFYFVTLNSINTSRSDIAKAKADTARYQAEATQLGPYGDFSKVKEQRVAAVKLLAQGRVDWERMVRELSRVLPSGVWLTDAKAADSSADAANAGGASSASAAPASASASASPTAGAAPAGPVLTLSGCAPDQGVVATTLVRLREMQGANDVQLDHSTQVQASSGGSSSSASAGSGDCGTTNGQPNYGFQINVSFDPQAAAPSQSGSVPSSLGGGQ